MDACWQQWPCQQYWRSYHKNHGLLIFRTVIGLHLLNFAEKRWLMMMKYSFSVCCFVLEFFLTFWSEFITSTEITASPSVSPLLAANPIFLITLKSCLHPLRYHDKSLSHCANGHVSRFFNHYNSISTQFSQLQMWKHLSRWLYCRRLFDLLVDTWSLVYHMIDKGFIRLMFLIIILPWLRF